MANYRLVNCSIQKMLEEESFMTHRVVFSSDNAIDLVHYVLSNKLSKSEPFLSVISKGNRALTVQGYQEWKNYIARLMER